METQENTQQEDLIIRTNIELDRDVWYKAKKKAKELGTNASSILRILLKMWVNGEIDIIAKLK